MEIKKSVIWRCLTDGVRLSEVLNPNCSEVVWKLDITLDVKEAILKSLETENSDDDWEGTISTDNSDENCLFDMIEQLEGAKNIDTARFVLVENQASIETEVYVKECFEIAKRYKKGEITLNQAEKMEKEAIKIKNEDDDEY